MRILSLVLALFLVVTARAQMRVVFDETFDSNVRAWHVGGADGASAAIDGGVYRIGWPKAGQFWYLSRFGAIDSSGPYAIEMTVRLASGVTNQGYGLAWGIENGKMNLFLLSGDGHAKVTTYDGSWVDRVAWTKSPAIHGTGEWNRLRIEKRGDRMHFSVNGTEVATSSAPPLYGMDHGVYVQDPMTVEVDRLVISQDRPPIRVAPGAPPTVEKINLGPNVNTPYVDYVPLIAPDGRTLYYSTRHSPENTGGVDDMDEIWSSTAIDDTTWGMRRRAPAPLNNDGPNWVLSVTPDNATLLLGNTYAANGTLKGPGLSMARRNATGWDVPTDVVVRNLVNRTNYNTFCLSPNRRVLVMSVHANFTHGRHDLYFSMLESDGTWSEPKNMGPTINSFAWEFAPFLASDGVTLYFASNGHPGYGWGDIFMSRRLDDTWENWSVPENLGPAINSPLDEGGFTIPASGRQAYLVSNENTLGGADIFRIRLPGALAPEPVVLVRGRVLDTRTKRPIGAEIVYRDLATDLQMGAASSDPASGEYQIVLPAGRTYSFMANRDGYYAVSDNLDATSLEAYREIDRDLHLTPIEVGSTVRLNNVFFDVARWELRSESHPELDRVVRFLEANPTIAIEVAGHTDNVGTDADNRTLSENRARAVREYLESRDVDAARLTSRGYGESKPVATNDSDAGRQLNRRVEFTIVRR